MGACNASPYVCVLPAEVREREHREYRQAQEKRGGTTSRPVLRTEVSLHTGHRATMVVRTDSHGNGFREVLGLFNRHGISREMREEEEAGKHKKKNAVSVS